jgi:hypothetical protein
MDSVRIQLGMLSMLTNQADELSRNSQVKFKINKITSLKLFVKLIKKLWPHRSWLIIRN